MNIISVRFDIDIANQTAYTNQDVFDKVTGAKFLSSGVKVGVATGYVYKYDDGKEYAEIFVSSNQTFYNGALSSLDFLKDNSASYQKKSTDLLKAILQNHQYTMENLLVCAGLVTKLEQKGINCDSEKRVIIQTYNSLIVRNKEIKESVYLEQKNEAFEPTLTSLYSDDLNKILGQKSALGVNGIGELATLTVIIVTAVVTGIFAYICYLAFKKQYSTSKSDLKISDDLKLALSSLDPETRQSVINDLESQVDAAYAKGMMNAKSDSFLSQIKNIILVGGGVFLTYKLLVPTTGSRKKAYKPKLQTA